MAVPSVTWWARKTVASEYMFIMMNAARYGVGVQGIAIGERAYQQAPCSTPKTVCKAALWMAASPRARPIIHHPDVKRMLMTMRATVEGCRAMATVAAAALRRRPPPPRCRTRASRTQAFYEFMVPLVKGYSTEISLEVTSLGVQVHGGMGFIEETGAAQYYRDAKNPDHLRRHHRHPGQRPGGPQDSP